MRLVRFADAAGAVHFGRELSSTQAERLRGELTALTPTGEVLEITRRLAPLAPTNIFCIGANYPEHAKESNAQVPERPLIFMKPTSALNDPDRPIRIPLCSDPAGEVDYECELVAVIGKAARNVSIDRASDYVLGYTAGCDVSARWWQKTGGNGQWVRGKGFDTFAPLGPVLVTADEIPNPQDLALSTTLNGKVMQQGHTSQMAFPVAELIAFLSQDTTLLPGTAIFTGTPAGVGMARNPRVFLKPGDQVVVEVEKIGKLCNPVEAAEGWGK